MKQLIRTFAAKIRAGRRLAVLAPFVLLALTCAGWLAAQRHDSSALVVHEWGTFTAIAGRDGNALEWTALPNPAVTDLPGFVEHLGAANFKVGLVGKIRMETPVMYFYAPRETSVSVRVAFSKGLISEWYPHADRVEPSGFLRFVNLNQLPADGTIAWNDLGISPNFNGDFPRESRANRYYSARQTASAPVRVKTKTGEEQEKFLFYRGVSAAALPLSANLTADGSLLVKNLGQDEIPAVILFERRGEKVGYRLAGTLTSELVLSPPELTGSLDSLLADLEGILVRQGLYQDEAHAMVETWHDSWFEEGSRLIYLVPEAFVNRILPVSIDPQPTQMQRVFVGRLEIVTPATAKAVEMAVATHDQSVLNKYGRFVEAILQVAQQGHSKSDTERTVAQSAAMR